MDGKSGMGEPRLGLVALAVADLERSARFYSRLVGLRRIQATGGRAWMGAGERPLLLLIEEPGCAPRAADRTGIYHVALLLPSRLALALALQRIEEAGQPLRDAEDHLISEALYLTDPDGIGVEIYRDRPPASWPWRADGELTVEDGMLPLDLDDLRAELAGLRDRAGASGLPPATRMGHVHLQVPDVEQAGAFYCDLLGMRVTGRVAGMQMVAAGDYHHHLGLNSWRTAGAGPAEEGMAGLRYFTVVVSPAQRAGLESRLRANPAVYAEQDGAVWLRDPFGNPIRIVSDDAADARDLPAPPWEQAIASAGRQAH